MSKIVLILFPLLLRGLILVPPTSIVAVTYNVKPDKTSIDSCPDESDPCQTLDYYITNGSVFHSSANITIKFLNGTHTTSKQVFNVTGLTRLSMIAESENVTIRSVAHYPSSWFIKGAEFHMENLTVTGLNFSIQVNDLRIWSAVLNSSELHLQPPSQELPRAVDAELIGCKFNGQSFIKTTKISNLSLSDCEFLNISLSSYNNPVTVYYSTVYLSGTSKFIGANQSAILAFFSKIIFHGTVVFMNNTGIGGGALAIYSTPLYIDNAANISFINNKALKIGGAIYVDRGVILRPDSDRGIFDCFYQIIQPLESSTFELNFTNNSATFGGNDIYGTSLRSNCLVSNSSSLHYNVISEHFHFDTDSLSSVSGDPLRVCVCDSNGKPQCADLSSIFMSHEAYPGETITISAVVVGGDFGTTTGTVSVGFLKQGLQYKKVVSDNTKCTKFNYTLYPGEGSSTVMHLSTLLYYDDEQFSSSYHNKDDIERAVWVYKNNHTILFTLLTTPVFIDVSFHRCPPGFSLMITEDNNSVCDCHPLLQNNIKCNIVDGNVSFAWSSNVWIGVNKNDSKLMHSEHCPFDYCKNTEKQIQFDFRNESDADVQCALNRTGRLCGSCRNGYSLAIGSSRCIKCWNNNYVALIIFFAAAGFLLVFFISVLNLTVAQGMINGLIFYANIVWGYQSTIFPRDIPAHMHFLKTFLAWLNLDFGIETCFIEGMNGFWKTWLQFVFPFYTAGLFFIGLRFSAKLSKLFGDRSVPILATLLFLSYTKLLRTIIAALDVVQINILSVNSTVSQVTVWSIDGNLEYGRFPHILLVFAALACLLLLWLPYTVLLLLMQWLRKIPHSNPSRLITRYKPVFDAHYAPLKDEHHYWFGVLLLAQGVLLLLSSLTSNICPSISLLLVIAVSLLLLFYMSFMQVYRRTVVLMTESSFFINLMFLIGITLFRKDSRMIVLSISIFVVFLEFCGIILWSVIWTYYLQHRKSTTLNRSYQTTQPTTSYSQFRDSILEDLLSSNIELSQPTY